MTIFTEKVYQTSTKDWPPQVHPNIDSSVDAHYTIHYPASLPGRLFGVPQTMKLLSVRHQLFTKKVNINYN